MANPVFKDEIIRKSLSRLQTSHMTLEGAINKSGILLVLTVLGGALGWGTGNFMLVMGFLIASLVLTFVIVRTPERAPVLAPVYALMEGYILGAISYIYHIKSPGIVSNAIMLTLCALFLMLVLYRTKIIRVTDKFRSVLVVATSAVCLTYFLNMVLMAFGTEIPMIHQASPLGIGFSIAMVGLASFNLLLDFDMIEKAFQAKAPKSFEWYCGFALLVTLVWVYLEVLRLLGKLNRK